MRIVLADPQPESRLLLRTLLAATDHELAGEAGDTVAALRLVEQQQPDVLVVDISHRMFEGVETARVITRRGLPTRVVALGVCSDTASVTQAFGAGIRAFVNKATSESELLPALRRLAAGSYFLSPVVTESLVQIRRYGSGSRSANLTTVERDVLYALVNDTPVADIATQLTLSLEQIDSMRAAILLKLGISGSGGLVRHAVRQRSLAS